MKKLLPILVVVMFVVACGTGYFVYGAYKDYRGGEDVEVVNYNKEAQTLVVDQLEYQYQTEITEFMEDLLKYTQDTYQTILLAKVDNSNRDKLIEISNEFSYKLNNFSPSPITDKDDQFEPYVYDLKQQSDKLVYFALQYINKKSLTDKSLYLDAYNELKITIGTIAQLEDKLYR